MASLETEYSQYLTRLLKFNVNASPQRPNGAQPGLARVLSARSGKVEGEAGSAKLSVSGLWGMQGMG